MWDFESGAAGKPASGFHRAVGEWSIAMDGQNHVLSQTAQNADSIFNVILRPDVLFADVELSVRLKAVKVVVDQGGGLIWRAKNSQTYYLARFNPLEDSFRVYKVVDGKRVATASHHPRRLSNGLATLNGVRLPSADPRKRAVNIDIFPTGTIESMTVTKTFTPDTIPRHRSTVIILNRYRSRRFTAY